VVHLALIIAVTTATRPTEADKIAEPVNGRDFWTEHLPDNHPIFTACFDLKGGMTSELAQGSLAQGKFGVVAWDYLKGYFIKGRLAGVEPAKGWGWLNQESYMESTRQMQMTINVIIYALTQEGSMTQRLMQMEN